MNTSKKDKILDLFFNEHLEQIDIAKELNVSKQYVSITHDVLTSPRAKNEKRKKSREFDVLGIFNTNIFNGVLRTWSGEVAASYKILF